MTSSPGDAAAERDARAALDAASAGIVDGAADHLGPYLRRRAGGIVAAWRGRGGSFPAGFDAELTAAIDAATARTLSDLRALTATDPADQRVTPLEVLRSAAREPTSVLAAAGVADVERDEFAMRSFPDDRYDLMPRTLADLDESLGPLLVAWGLAKTAVLRARDALP